MAWQSVPRAKRQRSFAADCPVSLPTINRGIWKSSLEPTAKSLVIASTYLPKRVPAAGCITASYTYWVNNSAFRQNKGMRLDFLLFSAPLQAVLTAAGVDTEHRGREKPSDHTPTWVALCHPT
jgi:hypothetical protein